MPPTSILPYALQTIQPLKELFLQDNIGDIPNIELKPNSDFNLITTNIASLAVTQTASDNPEKQISDIFDAIAEYIQDARNLPRLQSIEIVAKNFANILTNSYSTMNDIAVIVDDLRKKLLERYVILMRREKAEDLLSDTDDTTPKDSDYVFIGWESLKTPMRQSEVIEAACRNINLSSAELNLMNLSYITKKLVFTTAAEGGFTNAVIPDDTNALVFEKLKTAFSNDSVGIPEGHVRIFWDAITSVKGYMDSCQAYDRLMGDVKNVAQNCLALLTLTDNFDVLCNAALKVVAEDISGDTLTALNTNLEAVKKTVYAVQYWLLFNKEVRYKDKLILSKTIINRPVYEEFVQSGKTLVAIHNYLKAFHMELPLPLDGISITTVSSVNLEERLIKAAAKLKSTEVYIKSKCLIGAYEYAMSDFIKDTIIIERFPQMKEQAFVEKFIILTSAKASMIGGKVENLDAILYDVVIKTLYNDGLIETMYTYLNKNFTNLAETSEGDLTDDDIVKSQCFATVEMLVDYLFKILVTTDNPYRPK